MCSYAKELEYPPIKRIKLETGYCGVTLPSEEEVTILNSREFDERVRDIKKVCSLTEGQAKYIARCKRMIRNREQARESRGRQKQLIADLKAMIATLELHVYTQDINYKQLLSENVGLLTELNACKKIEHPMLANLSIQDEMSWFDL